MEQAQSHKTLNRRLAILSGGAVLAGGVAILASRSADRGGAHNPYFARLAGALQRAGIAHPVLVVDRNRLDANITAARKRLQNSRLPLRIVVKSLPSAALIDRIATGMPTTRFMVFNGAMLGIMVGRAGADILLGKPLPVREYADAIKQSGPAAAQAIQWLIDTPERLKQYAELAAAAGIPLRANFEIDIGMHRGGFPDAQSLARVLDLAKGYPHVSVSGLMGYDAHVRRMSDPAAEFANTQRRYRDAIDVLKAKLSVDPNSLTLNGAGSPTYARHAETTVANEVSVGSAFVKPVNFDTDTLRHHIAASFIATPVIKAAGDRPPPGFERFAGFTRFMDPNTSQKFFIYGGHWMATPESPPGLQYFDGYGRSSNQELLTGSDRVRLKPDDFVFFRPDQSEAVFLQFGPIAVFDGAEISEFWPTFPVSA